MKFVDLFAGLGGFHLALRRLGHECVFACEIDPELRRIYRLNFGIEPFGDIRELREDDVPDHDILCAGFPCQPFSKAGNQLGFSDPILGGLIWDVMRIVQRRRPTYVILENVPNFERHNRGRTMQEVLTALIRCGYSVHYTVLSPHQFGIPQIRQRLFIVASLKGLEGFEWPEYSGPRLSLVDLLDSRPPDAKPISEKVSKALEAWQLFLEKFPREKKLPSFPIWAMEFGATYPYEHVTPLRLDIPTLRQYCGSFGCSLDRPTLPEIAKCLPSYARTNDPVFPAWKQRFIRQNRELYEENKDWIDCWKKLIVDLPQSYQKFEWNCGDGVRDLWRYVVQLRPSGIRVKRPDTAPSLVALTTSQVPIVAWEQRYMTVRECARLQSMSELKFWPSSLEKAYHALGNAVNVDVVYYIAVALLHHGKAQQHQSVKVTPRNVLVTSGAV